MVMCISKAIPKWVLSEIFELDYFSSELRWNWVRLPSRDSGSGIGISGAMACSSTGPVLAGWNWYLPAVLYVSSHFARIAGDSALWKCEIVCKLWKRLNAKGRIEWFFQSRVVQRTPQTTVVGHLPCKNMNSARYAFSIYKSITY